MNGLFAIRKAAHARRHNDETCHCCLSCYKAHGVRYQDPDCQECLGICSTEEHVDWLLERFGKMSENVEVTLVAKVRVGTVRVARPFAFVRADGTMHVFQAGERLEDFPVEIVEVEARVL